jgi:hypothetical protein
MNFPFLLIISLFFGQNTIAQQRKTYPEFCGKWINVEYEYVVKYDSNKNGTAHITPLYLVIDSFGFCKIISRFEQMSDAGKPFKEQNFGKIKELTYRHWGEMYLTQVANDSSKIALSSKNNGMSILLRKIK